MPAMPALPAAPPHFMVDDGHRFFAVTPQLLFVHALKDAIFAKIERKYPTLIAPDIIITKGRCRTKCRGMDRLDADVKYHFKVPRQPS